MVRVEKICNICIENPVSDPHTPDTNILNIQTGIQACGSL